MKKQTTGTGLHIKPKIKRKGRHSKTKSSNNKKSKSYKKMNVGQG